MQTRSPSALIDWKKLFETFVCAEISSLIDANDGMYQLFHYRDREQREIDFIIEREDEVLLGIEVKASTTVGRGDFKNLRWVRDNIAGDRPFFGLVLYAGTYTGSMGKNLAVVPFGSLW